jgi:hypothetical protein
LPLFPEETAVAGFIRRHKLMEFEKSRLVGVHEQHFQRHCLLSHWLLSIFAPIASASSRSARARSASSSMPSATSRYAS